MDFHQRQRHQRRQDHLAIARWLALVTDADRAVGPIQLREHEIVTISVADLFLRHGMDIDDALPTKALVRIIVNLLAALPEELKDLASAAGVGAPPAV